MSFQLWLSYAAFTFVVVITPGPAILLTSSYGLSHGMRKGMGVVLGIELANTFYFFLSAAGLGALLAASELAFQIMKYCGAAYLIYLGLAQLAAAGKSEPGSESVPRIWGNPAFQGFCSQLINPKALLFYAAFLPQFIDYHSASVGRDLAILAVTDIGLEVPVLAFYMYAAIRGARLIGRGSRARWRERASGAAFLTVGAAMLLTKRAA